MTSKSVQDIVARYRSRLYASSQLAHMYRCSTSTIMRLLAQHLSPDELAALKRYYHGRARTGRRKVQDQASRRTGRYYCIGCKARFGHWNYFSDDPARRFCAACRTYYWRQPEAQSLPVSRVGKSLRFIEEW